jgi:hypothetical protein
MALEDKIAELQRELALKNAFLTVTFSFGKSGKFPQEVQDQITKELREYCTKRAEKLDTIPEQAEVLSKEDVEILKQLSETIKKKSQSPTVAKTATVQPTGPKVSDKVKFGPSNEDIPMGQINAIAGRKAILLHTESIHPSQKAKASSGMEVLVNMVRPDGFVNLRTKEGYQFNVPLEDIEVVQQ